MKDKFYSLINSLTAKSKTDNLTVVCKRLAIWLLAVTFVGCFFNGWVKALAWLVLVGTFGIGIYIPAMKGLKNIAEKPRRYAVTRSNPIEPRVFYYGSSTWPIKYSNKVKLSEDVIAFRNALTEDIEACVANTKLWRWCWPDNAAIDEILVHDVKEDKTYSAHLNFVPGAHPVRVSSVEFVKDSVELQCLPNSAYIIMQKDTLYRHRYTSIVDDFIRANVSRDAMWYWVDAAEMYIAIFSHALDFDWEPAFISMEGDDVEFIKVINHKFLPKPSDEHGNTSNVKKTSSSKKRPKDDVIIEDPNIEEEGLDISAAMAELKQKAYEHYKGKLSEQCLAMQIDSECAEAVCEYMGDGEEPCYYCFPASKDETWEDYAIRDDEAEIFASVVVDTVPNISGYSCINKTTRKITFVVDV